MSKVYDFDEISEGMFPITLKIINWYQRKDPSLLSRLITVKYRYTCICVGKNKNFNLIICGDKIFIMSTLQR